MSSYTIFSIFLSQFIRQLIETLLLLLVCFHEEEEEKTSF